MRLFQLRRPPESMSRSNPLKRPPQIHHLHPRLPLLDHRTSLYLIVFPYYIVRDLSLFWCFITRIGCITWWYLILYFLRLIYRHHFCLYLTFFLFPLLISLLFFFNHVVSPVLLKLHVTQEVPLPPFICNRSRHIEGNVDLGWGGELRKEVLLILLVYFVNLVLFA